MAAKKKAAAKAKPKKAAPKKAASKNRGGIAQVVSLSPDLQAVVGASSLTRAELTKKVWDYIKKNGLQDAKIRRNINADEKLGKIFGGKKQVSMFEMTKLVNKHVK
ncbi:MAG TPA: SWIB/MDM2 domain-containing protein [Nevskiaceae bacterium]|nr:SWIB/MDM2 domain-containing protein [Nevskiaceae bacterium]